jgi:uncharacterized membrane protein YqiK
MDISVKTIDITRTGNEGLICQDNIRADIRISFFVRVNKTTEDVIKVAQAIGTARASDKETLRELFNAKFSEALKTVGKQLDFTDLYTKRDEFRDRIIQVIGTDLNGYSLEDAAINYLEQTPLAQLDSTNILDAQGIRKITELTAVEHVHTNEFQRHEEKEITRQNVDAREAILELERRQADAELKQWREIETVRAREEAETARVMEEERLRAQSAFLRTEEKLGVQRENQAREVAVAEKNRERVIAIESERIEKDRQLEVIARERETALTRISAEKEVEAKKREIAEVVRERVAVDRTVAEQEKYRLRLEAEKDIRLAGLDVQRQVTGAQATVLATGLENSDINIVGGDSVFLGRLVSSIALGKSVDGFVQHSDTAQALVKPWLDGSAGFPEDVIRMLGSLATSDVQNLTVSALLMRLMKTGGTPVGLLQQLLEQADRLGLADTPLSALNGSAKA